MPAVDLLSQLARRAEDLTPDEQARSFVAIRRIEGALKNRDSRIIFGRRGTGKTHILSYVANHARERREIPCLIDLRTLGSNNSIYADESIPPHSRATTLIRDLLSALHDQLIDRYTEPTSVLPRSALDRYLDNLSVCVKTVVVNDQQEVRGKISARSAASFMAGGELKVAALEPGARVQAETQYATDESNEWETRAHGVPRLSINMGNSYAILNDIAQRAGARIWILLDEWSSIPQVLQPYLADFIRRAFLPVQNITVQIAAIEFRSSFRADFESDCVGLELGSDITADINLDDYFVYDASPLAAVEFFKELLFRHLSAFAGEAGLKERSADEVTATIFSQDRVFSELTKASEGVARDFINILQLAAMRSDQTKITMNEIRSAAKDWFERDKQRNVDIRPKSQALLEWIRDSVLDKKKARAFLLKISDTSEDIEFLFDERILHIARRSYSTKDQAGVRYRVWKVDYGCYVDLINTGKNPTGFLFDGLEMRDGGEIEVPDDDYRAVRRAILNLEDFESHYRQ